MAFPNEKRHIRFTKHQLFPGPEDIVEANDKSEEHMNIANEKCKELKAYLAEIEASFRVLQSEALAEAQAKVRSLVLIQVLPSF